VSAITSDFAARADHLAPMKRLIGTLLLLFVCSSAIGAGDVLQSVGISRAEAGKQIVDAITGGYVYSPAMRNAFVKAPAAARTALVEQSLVWIKAFVMSSEFDKLYAAARAEAKPQPAEAPEGSIEDEVKAREEEMANNLAEMKKMIAQLPPEMRKEAEKQFKQAEADWKKTKNDPRYKASLREQAEEEREGAQSQHAEELQRWNEEWPANPRTLVAKRLREFLAESKDVAYGAKLVKSGSKMRFADANLEAKSSEWKMCYRAGKEPVEKARAFAQQWVNELK
jgi:Skp family chaperone for outer membrane proteins